MIAMILDTETTNLTSNRLRKLEKLPHVVEFYGCLMDLQSATMLSELEHLIRPPIPMPQESSEITGLKDEDLKDMPQFAAVADDLAAYIEAAPAIIAHNAAFDKEVIDIEFERLGRKLKWPRTICSVEATIHIKGYRLDLNGLHEYLFGHRFLGAHRARHDVEALSRCCVELFKRGEL